MSPRMAGSGVACPDELFERLVQYGMDSLLQGQLEGSTWALDSALHLFPEKVGSLWQRGLACYYSGRYEDGVRQFEADMADNGSDVEEVIWHFLCRCKVMGFTKARADGFLPLAGSPSVPPMMEVLRLFQGDGTVDEVLSASRHSDGSPVLSYNNSSALAYAHFYIGVFHELQGNLAQAKEHLQVAAEMQNPDYVGKLMQMHYSLFCRQSLPQAYIPLLALTSTDKKAGYTCSSIIQGGWQLSEGHMIGSRLPQRIDKVAQLLKAFDSGITAFDCGDIYTGVEELFGQVIAAHKLRGGKPDDIIIHTKLVPDLDIIQVGKVDLQYVRAIVNRSLNRLGVKKLDLVQFHWWDFSVPGYVDAARSIHKLSGEGLIRCIGITNFDTAHTRELLDAGIPITSNQVQYSLLDRRPLFSGLVSLCLEHDIKILAYGVLAGGFLTDSWLGVQPPDPKSLTNRSLVKYLLIIEEFGGWDVFQKLLLVLRNVADKHSPLVAHSGSSIDCVSIAMVAMQYIRTRKEVGGIIIGAHDERHLCSTVASAALRLTDEDIASIESVLALSEGPHGEVFALERDFKGPHGEIMKYNLNQVNQGNHLEELCHRFLQLFFRAHPGEATRAGYRLPPSKLEQWSQPHLVQQYTLLAARACNCDHSLELSNEQEIIEYCEAIAAMLAEVEGLDDLSLTKEQLVDKKLIESQLKLDLVRWQEVRDHNRDPGFYLPLNPLLYLLPVWGPESSPSASGEDSCHPGAADMSIDDRLSALLSRLRLIPQVLSDAKKQLSSPGQVFVSTAIEICGSFIPFLENNVLELCQVMVSSQESQLESHLTDIAFASKIAAQCVQNYEKFLRDVVQPKAIAAAGIGKKTYESILKYAHFIDSSDELLALGVKHFEKVKSQLEAVAREIDPAKSWQEITKTVISPKHPQASELLDAYMSEIERARSHMEAANLMPPIPVGERVIGFYTPKFLQPFSPFGDFLNPSPFAGMGVGGCDGEADRRAGQYTHRIGHLMLHSVEAMALPKEEEEKLLHAHDYTFISVIAPHESYPGHHLQALLAQTHVRVLRKFVEATLFYEGWGLYVEQLAYETGFFEKACSYRLEGESESHVIPASVFANLARLTQLRLQLWRAARIILDVKLNTGNLSFEKCRDFLHQEVMFNPQSSKGEAFMYVSRPGYAPCYVAGFVLFMALRERMQQNKGQQFTLKEFHSAVLSKGCIPLKLLELLIF